MEQVVDASVQLLSGTVDAALNGYLVFAKALVDKKVMDAANQIVTGVANGWKTALSKTPEIVNGAYDALIDKEDKRRRT
jgi:hypothetical protein